MQVLSQLPAAAFAADICQQELLWDAAAVHVAAGFVPCSDTEVPGLEAVLQPSMEDQWRPAEPLCSMLPPGWSEEDCIHSMTAA